MTPKARHQQSFLHLPKLPNWQTSKAETQQKKWDLVQEYEYKRYEEKFDQTELNQSIAIESGGVVQEELKYQNMPEFMNLKAKAIHSLGSKRKPSLIKTKFKLETIKRSKDLLWKKDHTSDTKTKMKSTFAVTLL